MPPEEAAPEQSKKKTGRDGLKTVLTMAGVLVVCVVLGFVFTKLVVVPRIPAGGDGSLEGDQTSEGQAGAAKKPDGAPIYYDPIDLIVNIEDKGTDRFLIVELDLELESEAVRAEIQELEPRIRDRINGVLRSKSYDDIKGATGQDSLRTQLVEKLNTLLERGRVLDVDFSKFQIQ